MDIKLLNGQGHSLPSGLNQSTELNTKELRSTTYWEGLELNFIKNKDSLKQKCSYLSYFHKSDEEPTWSGIYTEKGGKEIKFIHVFGYIQGKGRLHKHPETRQYKSIKNCENMDHSDPRTTQMHCLDMFDQDTLDDANDSIL